MSSAEHQRLDEAREHGMPWRRWGPYVSERQWGTVREDYSADGDAWHYLSYEQARSRAYRWGEDGIAGICDDQQRLCFALTLWNEADPMLKERLFGLSGPESAMLHLLPTLWFRNTWSWGADPARPSIGPDAAHAQALLATHATLGRYRLHFDASDEVLFTATAMPRGFGDSRRPASPRTPFTTC